MAVHSRDDWPTVAEAQAGITRIQKEAANRSRLAKAAAADTPDSKGPAGTGKFGGFKPENFTEWANENNPYGTASTFDAGAFKGGHLGDAPRPLGDMGNALRQAMGTAPQRVPLPEMEGRLFKAFTDAEGRDPGVDDQEFWKALVTVRHAYGERVAAEVIAAAEGMEGESIQKAADDLVARFSKELNRDVPTWVTKAIEESRTK
jgi:hypothetical protein